MADGEEWTGLIKLYKVLQKTPSMTDRLSEGLKYTVLTYSTCYFSIDGEFEYLLQSTTALPLLMVFCETNQLLNVETKQIFESIFNSLKNNQPVKIILNTQSENDTVNLLLDIAK
jgi:hypothetical protein